MLVTIIARHLCTVNINAIVLLTLYQKYYGEKLLYQRSTYGKGFFVNQSKTAPRFLREISSLRSLSKLCHTDFRQFFTCLSKWYTIINEYGHLSKKSTPEN